MTDSAALPVVVVGTLLLLALVLRWVPAQPVPPVSPTDLDRDFTPEEQQRERRFRRRVRAWGLAGTALDVLVPTALVVSGVLVTDAVPGPWWVGVVVVTSVVLLASRLVTLPGAVVVRRVSLEYSLAAGPWRRWLRDVVVGFVLAWSLGCLAMCGWVGAIRLWPHAWWMPVGAVAGLLVLVLSFLVPVVIEPLFARFTPMAESPLRSRLLELAAHDGLVVGDVLVTDASTRTTALNAYVSGLGATRRVVVHDTLLGRGRDDDVRAVVAHELGHVVAHDVRTGTVLGAGGAVVVVAAASVVLSWEPVLRLAHLSGSGEPAVAGLLLAAGAWASLLGAPIQSAVSRRVERRADQHCLELTGDPGTVAAMHRSLAVTNLASLRPPRLLQLWFGSHPTSPERIAAARAWASSHGSPVPADLVGDAT